MDPTSSKKYIIILIWVSSAILLSSKQCDQYEASKLSSCQLAFLRILRNRCIEEHSCPVYTDSVRQTISRDCTDRQRLNRSTYGPLMIRTSLLGEAYERLTILTDCTDLQSLRRSVYGLLIIGVSNGLIQFKSGRRIWPLLEWLPKITWVLAKFLQVLACWDSR